MTHWRSALVPVIALLAAATAARATHAYDTVPVDQGATVAGHVRFGTERPDIESFKIPKDNHVCGIRKTPEDFVIDEETGGLQNVVIELRGVEAGKPVQPAVPQLTQKECAFVPHLQVAAQGTRLVVTNNDPVLHNVHAFEERTTLFNVAQPPVGNLQFKKELSNTGVVRVVCDVHDWMSAYVYVVDHPYVAVTDEVGQYRIEDVPPGTYTLVAWHEALGEIVREVTVAPNGAVTENFDIGK